MSLHIGITSEVVALLLEYNADPDKPWPVNGSYNATLYRFRLELP